MSESTSAPAAPAAPATDRGAVIAPAPDTQAPLTVSEAGRLLSQQRRQAAGDAAKTPAAAAPPSYKPSPNEMAAAAAQKPAEAPAATAQNPALSPLERALGVPGDVAPATESTTLNDGAIVEIEGQRLRTLDEVREFAQRKTQDYTQKTQALAQQARQLQAQQEALATVLPYIQPELARLAETVQGAQRPDPQLLNSDPTTYLRQMAAFEQARDEQARIGNLTTLQQQAQTRAMEQQVAAANEQLAREFPFWADPAERQTAQNEIVAWATTKGGFQREALRGLTDANILRAMMKAMQFDKWVAGAKTAAPRQQTTAPVRGTAPPPRPTERIQVAQQTFEERPNIRTGAALLAARRGNGAVR